jgi:phage-related protein
VADGFKIADAYVDVETKYDRDQVTEAAQVAGEDAGEEFSRSSGRRLRDSRGRFISTTEDVFGESADKGGRSGGRRGARSLLRSMGDAVKATAGVLFTPKITGAIGEGLMGFVKSPVGLAAVGSVAASLGTMLAAGIASTLAVALGSGIGLGFIGLGAFLLKDEPKLIEAAKRIGNTFKNVFGGAAKTHFLKPMIQALGIINTLLHNLRNPINAIFKALAPAIVPLARGLSGMIENMMPGLTALMAVVGQTLGFEEPLMSLGAFINEALLAVAKNWPKIMESFFMFMEDLGTVLRVLGTAFIWLSTHYEAARNVFLSIMAISNLAVVAVVAVYKAYQYLAENIPRWLSSAGNAIVGFFTAIGSTVSGWYHSTIGWFQGVGAAIVSFYNTAVAWLGALPGRVGSFLATLPGIVARWLGEMTNRGLFLIGYMIGSWIKFFIDLPGRIARAVSTTWALMVGTWNTVRTNVTSWTRTAVDNAVRFFQALPGRARAAISSLWANMVGAFTSARTNATNSASSLVSGTVRWLSSLPGKARRAIAGVPGQIKSVFAGAGSWLYSAGANILRGLTSGMKGAVGAAINAAKNAAQQVINGLKSALGIGSPSKVAADEVGRWIPPGITQGIATRCRASASASTPWRPPSSTRPSRPP